MRALPSKMKIILTLVLLGLVPALSLAKEITVKADGSGDYATVRLALENMNFNSETPWALDAGDEQWGAANQDDVLNLGPGTFACNGNNPLQAMYGKLSIKGDPAGGTILKLEKGQRYVFLCGAGEITIQDVAIMGDVNDNQPASFSAIAMEAIWGHPLNLTVERVVITENQGGSPRMEFADTSATLTNANGKISGVMMSHDQVNNSPITFVMKNSVIAYTRDNFQSFWVGIPDRTVSGSSATFENCLFLGSQSGAIRMNGDDVALTLKGCAFVGVKKGSESRPVILLNPDYNQPLVIQDTIFYNNDHADINANTNKYPFTITLDRVTSYKDDTTMTPWGLAVVSGSTGKVTVNMRDVIGVSPGVKNRGLVVLNNNATMAGFTVSNIATPPGISAPQEALASAYAALYGNTGPLTADPQFKLTKWDAQFNGLRKWNRSTTTLLDVTNTAYAGKGTTGGRAGNYLAGGADGPLDPKASTGPLNASRNWSLYQ